MLRKFFDFLKKHTAYGKSRYLNFLYRYDMNRFLEYSTMNSSNRKQADETEIRLLIHSIEKALSLPYVRVGFGIDKVRKLLIKFKEYSSCKSEHECAEIRDMVYDAIYQYVKFQKEHGCSEDLSFIPDEMILARSIDKVGIDILSDHVFSTLTFSDFAKSRHSLRYFGNEKITDDQISKAVEIARTAPSACNRQPIQVYACMDSEKIRSIISMHGGMRGFGEPQAILVVTGSLGSYTCEYERNTVYVDGGIFLMNLLYAFHYLNIATCPIIWGMEPDNDKRIFDLMRIPVSNTIVSLVAVGSYPNGAYKFAKSSRHEVNEILHFSD